VIRQLVYALRFTGRARPAVEADTVLVTSAVAPSFTIATTIAHDGVNSSLEPAVGDAATLESELVFTGRTTFQEAGTIVFGGSSDLLRFSTLGSGYLGPSADPALRHGSVMRRIDGGEGRFTGASGLITSNFTLDGEGAVMDHQLGVIYLA
jgi:hypothetical protein